MNEPRKSQLKLRSSLQVVAYGFVTGKVLWKKSLWATLYFLPQVGVPLVSIIYQVQWKGVANYCHHSLAVSQRPSTKNFTPRKRVKWLSFR